MRYENILVPRPGSPGEKGVMKVINAAVANGARVHTIAPVVTETAEKILYVLEHDDG